jgi:hypothetical protein
LHENRCVREARKAWVWQLIDEYFDQNSIIHVGPILYIYWPLAIMSRWAWVCGNGHGNK